MKQCPKCHREYTDETLNFCLDDGEWLVDDSHSTSSATAILPTSDAPTKRQVGDDRVTEILSSGRGQTNRNITLRRVPWKLTFVLVLLAAAGAFFSYRYFLTPGQQIESAAIDTQQSKRSAYWKMTEPEQLAFIRERVQHVQALIGDEPTDLDDEAVRTIKTEIDSYAARKDSLSQKPFQEGLRVIYGRATQYAPLVNNAYVRQRVPPALGLYQAMVESEYRDCPEIAFENGPVGMFQFSRSTAAKYGLTAKDFCNVEKQSDAASRYMSDLASDFGEGKSNSTLGLFSYAIGETSVREYLRQLRNRGVVERSFWMILRHRKDLDPKLELLPPSAAPSTCLACERPLSYIPHFFAAAIIGETPEAFDLSTPPLSNMRAPN